MIEGPVKQRQKEGLGRRNRSRDSLTAATWLADKEPSTAWVAFFFFSLSHNPPGDAVLYGLKTPGVVGGP
jgi:hypothetical protein